VKEVTEFWSFINLRNTKPGLFTFLWAAELFRDMPIVRPVLFNTVFLADSSLVCM